MVDRKESCSNTTDQLKRRNFSKKAKRRISRGYFLSFVSDFSLIASPTSFVHTISTMLRLFSLRRPARGVIIIIIACFLPIILLGVKYSEKLFQQKAQNLTTSEDDETVKSCAQEAALEVARNWNPGLTFGQQQEAAYKVADAVYNAHPCQHNSILGRALPGMMIYDNNGNLIFFDASRRRVEYTTTNKKYFYQWYFDKGSATWNPYYALWLTVDKASEASKRQSKFDEMNRSKLDESKFVLDHHDICIDPLPYCNEIESGYPTDSLYASVAAKTQIRYNTPSISADSAGNYSLYNNLLSSYTRVIATNAPTSVYKLADSTYSIRKSSDYVEISIEQDKIKVRTDEQDGYAVPAQCNVDIVLAVPVNGAACNVNNRDAASDTAEKPYSYTAAYTVPSSVKSTPIYQMGQALKNFVKEHFYHTRGVNMALIPYSGKASISPDRAKAWTIPFPAFVDTATSTQVMIGACLYGTSGVKDASLKQSAKTKSLVSEDTLPTTDTPYYWGGVLTGCPIMFRAGVQQTETKYGGNSYFKGSLGNYNSSGTALSAAYTNPAMGNEYKYLRMNLNPCYMGYANLLSMKCEQQCTHFLPNPYYMIEPTADMVKIYEMCNALFPVHDVHNVSNFIFIPLEWAYNMFQSWTNDPVISTTPGTGTSATLSRPSKSTGGRKKAVILLVNKPDWFEQEELTYLGFSNDFSEIPMVEGDCIRFDINYSDTSKKFADGTSYDGTIRGAKKILKFTTQSGTVSRNSTSGYYECSSGTGRLSFPRKYLLKVVVEPAPADTEITLSYPKYSPSHTSGGGVIHSLSFVNNKFFAVSEAGYIMTSENGTTWSSYTSGLTGVRGATEWNYIWAPMCYINGQYVISGCRGSTGVSSNGSNWTTAHIFRSLYISGNDIRGCCQTGNTIILSTREGYLTRSTDGGSTWSSPTNTLASLYSQGGEIWTICGIGSKVIAFADKGYTSMSSNSGESWGSPRNNLKDLYNCSGGGYIEAACYTNNQFIAIANNGYASTSSDGSTWSAPFRLITPKANNICRCVYGKNQLVVISGGDGIIYLPYSTSNSSIKFTGINSQTNGTTTSQYELTERKEFFIEASQMTTGNDGNYYVNFDMQNIRLISAEITNRPYKRLTPTCSLSGTTNGSGSAYVNVNCKRSMTLSAKSTANGSVTFSNTNSSSISNSGTHSLTTSKTFSFPSSNFTNNYKLRKISYSLSNANISSYYLDSQVIRFSGKSKCDESCFANNATYLGNDIILTPGKSFSNKVPIKKGQYNLNVHRWVDCGHPSSVSFTVKYNDSTYATLNSASSGRYSFSSSNGGSVSCLNSSNGQWDSTGYQIAFSFSGSSTHNMTATSGSGSSGADNFIRTMTISNFDRVNSGNSSDSNSVYLDSGYICFRGTGALSLTVTPLATSGTLKYTTPQSSTASMSISSTKTVTISPETHKYEKQSDGTYRITLTTQNLQLSNLKLDDTEYAFEYTAPQLPSISRVADFSKNVSSKPSFDSSSLSLTLTKLTYDSDRSSWISSKSDYPWSEFYNKSIIGDFYFLIDDIGTITPELRFFNRSRGPETFSNVKNERYPIPGLHRRYQIFSDIRRAEMASFDLPNSHQGGQVQYIYGGFTRPVNITLYSGISGSSSSNDPTETVKKVTQNACIKLISDCANLRIYIVKYRKQEKYKHPITGSTSSFDYNYLNSCATATGGSVYDITSEAALKTTLDNIATEIKKWAEYTEAKNIAE